MFTGIVEEIGEVINVSQKDKFISISIKCEKLNTGTLKGDSISVNGVCLTVSECSNGFFTFDISPETLKKTTLLKLHSGDKVNLERAVTLETRLGGHMVSGHIDGTGVIKHKKRTGEGYFISIETCEDILEFIVNNGSIAVDGISLTIVELSKSLFSVMVIPHTCSYTTLNFKNEGNIVNIECDIIGKYVASFLKKGYISEKKGVTAGFLAEHGFML